MPAEGINLENPGRAIRRKKQPKAKIIIPSREQFRAMITATRQLVTRDAVVVLIADLTEGMAYSGMRLSEATELQHEF